MNRNFYFIGIAFFGMINGIFNQLWLIFALLYVQPIAGPLLFGNLSLTLMFASLMVSTATVILGGIPAAIYERVTSSVGIERRRSGSGWPAPALLALPTTSNFLKSASSRTVPRLRARDLGATLRLECLQRTDLAAHGRDAPYCL